jgi:ribosomal protein L7/L12
MFAVIGPWLYVLAVAVVLGLLFRRVLSNARDSIKPRRTLHAFSLEEIQTAIREGQTIDAIRMYREMLGCSLAEAKAAVEVLAANMAERD